MQGVGRHAALEVALENLSTSSQIDPADIVVVARYLASSPECRSAVVRELREASEHVKITIVHQFFKHPDEGTHRTSFDQEVTSELLESWFSISLNQFAHPPTGRFGARGGDHQQQIQTFTFGSTQCFLYMTQEKRRLLDSLVGLLADDAVLTTDRTSPPGALADLTPLWLKDRTRDPADHYVCDTPVVDFESFFTTYDATTRAALGVTFRESTCELGFVVNGDGLRYHRDRLVNQYESLSSQTSLSSLDRTRVVQDLSLVDWEMQDGTFSGTVFVHPSGDRYIFVIEPGDAISLLFAERVQLPGPAMMPYHCALPVQDSYGGITVGEAKGKRLSCLMRAVADAAEVDRLVDVAIPGDIHERKEFGGEYRFSSGMRIEKRRAPDSSLVDAGPSVFDAEQGCQVTRLSRRSNAHLLDSLDIRSATGVYRVLKNGDGFSRLGDVLPMIDELSIVVINRSLNTPQPETSYPLTVHLSHLGSPVLQLLELRHSQTVLVPAVAQDSLYLSPTAPIFHRSAPLDAFYPTMPLSSRIFAVVDVIVFDRT